MRLFFTLCLFCVFSSFGVFAQNGYKIEVELNGFEKDTLVLGYYLGNNQYVKDTVTRKGRGFVFEADTLLTTGIYIVIAPPLNDFLQLLIDDNDQTMKITADYDKGLSNIQVKGNTDNELYYEYVNFIKQKRPKSDSLRKQLDTLEVGTADFKMTEEAVKAIDNEVKAYTKNMITENPDTYTAVILRMNSEIEIPDFEGEKEDVQMKRFRYFKNVYRQNMQLEDSRSFRTPYLYDRVNYLTDNLTMRHPDSIVVTIDEVLSTLEPHKEAFQYYLVHFLNKYAKSKIVGHDGVYVHLAENYYAAGKAPWTDPEQLNKIVKNARELKPTLVGQIAPNIKLFNREGEEMMIHDVEAEYLVLYFWNPDCPHCKKSTPKIVEFFKQYESEGVKVMTVCGKTGRDLPTCWEYVDKTEGMDLFYNMADEFYRSKFKSVYYVKSTPKIFVLDADKKILSKGIGAEQLPKLMDILIEQNRDTPN